MLFISRWPWWGAATTLRGMSGRERLKLDMLGENTYNARLQMAEVASTLLARRTRRKVCARRIAVLRAAPLRCLRCVLWKRNTPPDRFSIKERARLKLMRMRPPNPRSAQQTQMQSERATQGTAPPNWPNRLEGSAKMRREGCTFSPRISP